MKSELNNKLSAYSGLVASVLLIPNLSEGQIVYTNPPNIELDSDSLNADYNLDLNSDGNFDFQVFATNYFGNHIWVGQNYGNPWELALYENCDSNYLVAFALQQGQPISPNNPHWKHDTGGGNYFNVCATFIGTCLSHRWGNKHNRFLGVRIPVPGDLSHYYYGWIRLSVAPQCKGVIIKDWAYNSIADQPIFAGQMMSPREADETEVTGKNDFINNDFTISSYDHSIIIRSTQQENNLNIEVFNDLGQLILTRMADGPDVTIDLPDAQPGIYIVKILSETSSESKKIFLQ